MVAKAKVFGWSFCMEFVFGPYIFALKRPLPDKVYFWTNAFPFIISPAYEFVC